MKRAVVVSLLLVVCLPAFAQRLPWSRWENIPIGDVRWGSRYPVDFVPIDFWTFCESWGFESDGFTAWKCQSGPFNAATTDVNCSTSAQHAVVASGADPQGMPQVGFDGGMRAVRIGDMLTGGNAAAIQRTITVMPGNSVFRYSYALVFADGLHPPAQQPYFRATATVDGTQVYSFTKVASTDGFFMQNNALRLRRWSCGVIDLTPYIGKQATIRFEAADCSLGGHFGYAYVDFPCDPPQVNMAVPERVCAGAPVLADGTANNAVVDHFWSVERSDANYGRNPAEEVMSWFSGPVTAPFDVAAFAAANGRPMTCGNYYRVKLALKTECEPWIETTKLVYVDCVKADAGPDQSICATHPQSVTLGSAADPGTEYTWMANGIILGNASTLTVMPTQSTVYELTAKNAAGCVQTSDAVVRVIPAVGTPQISVCYCGSNAALTASLPGYGGPQPQFHWSNGATSQSTYISLATLDPIDSQITYSVNADSGCDVSSVSITLRRVPTPSFIATNTVRPFSNIVENRILQIWHLGIVDGGEPAYGGQQWKLSVFDRFGGLIYEGTSNFSGCAAIPNGNVQWNGVANHSDLAHNVVAGQLVPIGEYPYVFEVMDCQDYWRQQPVNGMMRPSVLVEY